MIDQPSRKRPFGVFAIIFLNLFSACAVIGEFFLLSRSDFVTQSLDQLPDQVSSLLQSNTNVVVVLALTIGVGVLIWHVAVAIGLWFLKRWAWFLVMIQLGFSMAGWLFAYYAGEPSYVNMLLNTVIVFYLNQNEVQSAFGHHRTKHPKRA